MMGFVRSELCLFLGRKGVLLWLVFSGLRGDAEGFRIFQVAPESELGVLLEKVWGEDGLAWAGGDFFMDAVEAVEAELGIELWGVVLDGIEVVLERFFSEKLVDEFEDIGGAAGEHVVVDNDQALGELGVAGFAECLVGESDEAVGAGEGFEAGVDGGALVGIAEEAGVLEGVVAELALHRVHDPGDVAHEADELGFGEELHERGELGGPGAIGIEDDRLVAVGVVALEEAAKNARALFFVDLAGHLAAGRDLRDDAVKESGDWAGHASVEARVLAQ